MAGCDAMHVRRDRSVRVGEHAGMEYRLPASLNIDMCDFEYAIVVTTDGKKEGRLRV